MAKTSNTSKPRGPHQTLIQRSRSVGAAQKAQWHQVDGAGKSRVRRPFFGLTSADVAAIEQRVGLHLDIVVRKAS